MIDWDNDVSIKVEEKSELSIVKTVFYGAAIVFAFSMAGYYSFQLIKALSPDIGYHGYYTEDNQ